jgi:uncharacterized protein YdaU (DUF1376 family)
MTRSAFNAWMPLYVADYLRKTTRLTTEQHGAYMLLIMDYWVNGAPPDDDVALAQIVRLPLNVWRKHRVVILAFFSVKDGKWVHDRIEDERMKAFAITEVRRKGGQARQQISKASAQAEAHAAAGKAAGRPAEKQQAERPSQRTNLTSTLSTESGSAREPQPPLGAGSHRDDTVAPAAPKSAADLASKIQERLLDQVAGKRF